VSAWSADLRIGTTTNLSSATWTGLVTNTLTTNYFDYTDSGAVG